MAPVMDKDTSEASRSQSLRGHLRAATMAAHDLLDHAMQAASGWQNRADYARFVALQHTARAPLEEWLAAHAPADLVPPLQTPLLAEDLAALGIDVPAYSAPFAFPQTASQTAPAEALGAAWVLAGSALGNKAIAKQVAKIGGGEWPIAFLGDDAMMRFWQGLRARIEQPATPAEAEGATRAAEAVFAHFLGVIDHAPAHANTAEREAASPAA